MAMTADDFWRWMAAGGDELLASPGAVVADRIEEQLREIDPRLGVEVADPGESRELVITAWSRAEAFPVVRELVAAAPPLPGWRILALKPPRGFDFGINVDGLRIDARELTFDPLAAAENPKLLGIRVYVPSASDDDDPRLGRALPLIIEAGIGEEAAAQIDHTDAAAGPAPHEGALPIDQLLPYVQWHRRKHQLG